MTLNIGPHIVGLRQRVETLETENAELRTMLGLDEDVADLQHFGFSPNEARIVNLLRKRRTVTREQALFVCHPNNPDRRYEVTGNVVSVHLSRIRSKLRPLGCSLSVIYGVGWRLDAPDRLEAALAAKNGRSVDLGKFTRTAAE